PSLPAHGNAKYRADHQEQEQIRGEGGEESHERVEPDVDHQDRSATEPIGQPAEHESPERTQRQSERDRPGHLLSRDSEILGHILQHEDEQKEIEGIQHPAEKARDHHLLLYGVQPCSAFSMLILASLANMARCLRPPLIVLILCMRRPAKATRYPLSTSHTRRLLFRTTLHP